MKMSDIEKKANEVKLVENDNTDTAKISKSKFPTAEEAFRKSLKKFNLLYKKLADYDSSND